VSIVPLLINLVSAAFCLGCSAFFHLYFVRSEKMADVLSRLDYGGISVLIFGSACPVIVYGFSCEGEFLQRWLWLAAQALLCGTCFVVTLIKQFDKPKFRPLRAGLFIFAGLAIIGAFTALNINPNANKIGVFPWIFGAGGAVYITGAVIYAMRVPERCTPGRYDLCGASHQIFHFAVLGGCAIHFWQNYELFNERQVFECPMRP